MTLFREGFSGQAFLLCAGAGFLTAVLYDFFRIARKLLPVGKGFIFVADLLFCLWMVASAFLVSLPVGFGKIRSFQIAAEGIGAAAYFLTFGQITTWGVERLQNVICRAKKRCAEYVERLQRKVKGQNSKEKRVRRKKIAKT